ncbi:CheR family methyltransferase [Opitutus terrae]|uniref:protein-glutamate O-methyltransferase n=1 Tax=Opitutus terrae (strain DSM 11246 / JCM 15787 / PB90-1) TaxID=452637 RepID=B1ZR51_OPITP|nr:protein-glutamate O-methyltransferase CheR [Opitutus terrae]ACB73718.1 MCP methyltransferase, CheR-type [Opitutus terrae PB90-1]
MRESEFEFIRNLVYERSRINLSPDKRELVSARLGKRLRAMKLHSVGEYCRLLKSPDSEGELANLIDVISTNHTFFFRETSHFDFLRTTVVPEMKARAAKERWSRLLVWSAACSSGEEPYSIAITLAEALTGWPWQVQATDISHRVLEKARLGIYRDETVDRLPKMTVQTHFQRGFGPQDGNYRVKAALRSQVMFRHLNLLEGEPPFNELFHVIFCRNVMIYFDRPTQEELVNKLARRLVPGGYLFVGHAESLTGIHHHLQTVKPAIYRRPATHPL